MKTLCILLLAVAPAFAGVARFSARHSGHFVRRAAKASHKVGKMSAHGAVKAVKVAAKVAY